MKTRKERKTIINEANTLKEYEETKRVSRQKEEDLVKEKLHQDKIDGLNTFIRDIQRPPNPLVSDSELQQAAKKAHTFYPDLSKGGIFSKVRGFFATYADGWEKDNLVVKQATSSKDCDFSSKIILVGEAGLPRKYHLFLFNASS